MSLLPFSIGASMAISMMSVPGGVSVTDVSYDNVAGIDKQTVVAERIIEATVDTSEKRKLEQIFGGSVSDGDIGIYPLEEELYFLNDFTQGDQRLQSFIDYQGNRYRVSAISNFMKQAGVNAYLASLHITQDLI